jgi:hypothetical protein
MGTASPLAANSAARLLGSLCAVSNPDYQEDETGGADLTRSEPLATRAVPTGGCWAVSEADPRNSRARLRDAVRALCGDPRQFTRANCARRPLGSLALSPAQVQEGGEFGTARVGQDLFLAGL